jgi:hypothetical protein
MNNTFYIRGNIKMRYFTREQQAIIQRNPNSEEALRILRKDRVRCKVCGSYECECNDVKLDEWIKR